MSMPPPPPIDIVSVAIAVAALIFGNELAQVVGPYAVIVLGATLGGAISAARMEPGTGMRTGWHMLFYIGFALLMTVPLAYWLEAQFGFASKWLFGPLAVLVAGIGQDWPALARWAIDLVRGVVERKVKSEETKP